MQQYRRQTLKSTDPTITSATPPATPTEAGHNVVGLLMHKLPARMSRAGRRNITKRANNAIAPAHSPRNNRIKRQKEQHLSFDSSSNLLLRRGPSDSTVP
mmetsp:Transcript_17623/g.24604  ORF Transcript_17623/g.24604 Transcript_17623/m.24604 type:complete len:100 (+) Transcript_17623:357-656(+)|eukprot:CAMPEP_0185270688 /NCGR_PEP_ID=MMETSP1359-20130426/42882_1 /TAXON_ID=552665 /ORGANISM="Bigelowiella longifila, Strain CCMP242" /LENGTH=99 /DNA_ID=CAMNT_0027862343 /DNA_START=354 /DNA_END=653 /DNA_ORIENTATION=+